MITFMQEKRNLKVKHRKSNKMKKLKQKIKTKRNCTFLTQAKKTILILLCTRILMQNHKELSMPNAKEYLHKYHIFFSLFLLYNYFVL